MAESSVSIIIPTYNHAHFVGEAIDSALVQTHKRVELIVVDDGSTDSTSEVVHRYGSRVRYIRQRNRGLSAARNAGIRAASESNLVFLDADDRLAPTQVEFSLRALADAPESGLVCGDITVFGVRDFDHVHSCAPSPTHYATLLRGCFVVNIGACLIPRHVLDDIGDFDESLPSAEDWDLLLRIARRYQISCHHAPVLEYRRTQGQMSRDMSLMLSGSMTVLRRQRRFIGSLDLKQAYQEGRADIARYYASPLAMQVRQLIAARRWREALKGAACLATHFPSHLKEVFAMTGSRHGSLS